MQKRQQYLNNNKEMKKRIKPLSALLLFMLFVSLAKSQPAEIWLSPDGNDQNPGTREKPMASIYLAQRQARELRRLKKPEVNEGVKIILKEGTYRLTEPLLIRPEDSGTETSPTIITAEKGKKPVISGGISITDWKKTETDIPYLPENTKGKIWEADIPLAGRNRLAFRQLWVNDIKAIRASTINDGELNRILSVDKKNESFWIPKPDFSLEQIQNLEFVIHQWWAIANLRVKNIEIAGDSAKITFYQPESRIEFEHPWPAPFIDEKKELNGNSAYYFVNTIALLNSPGEWYADMFKGKVYYWPRKGEDLNKDRVIVPVLETLVNIDGSLDNPVSNIIFKGIQFQYTTWMRPSEKGHVPVQAGWSILDAYRLQEWSLENGSRWENHHWIERQPAAVELCGSNNIRFDRCTFKHLAATGLDLIIGTHNNVVKGCLFTDIGGTGIQIGYFGGPDHESHDPYNPTDEREICSFETISNNLITDVTNEDWGCVGVSVGYAHDITIEHNEVSHLNYSGICIGWGWTKEVNCSKNNFVHANYIHHFARMMNDIGGIYTLSAQPNSLISENRIESLLKAPYAHLPEHVQYIYFDEGTSYMRAENNWVEKAIFFENTPGPGNLWLNNNSDVDESIKENAGLTSEYKDLLKNYEEKGLSSVVAKDKKQKTIEYSEDYDFMEEGRGPR